MAKDIDLQLKILPCSVPLREVSEQLYHTGTVYCSVTVDPLNRFDVVKLPIKRFNQN